MQTIYLALPKMHAHYPSKILGKYNCHSFQTE